MASFEFLAVILTGLGLTVSILYYTTVLQNANKTQQSQLETRQAQLYMQVFQELNSEKRWKEYLDARYSADWDDYDDFQGKYGRESNPDFFAKLSSMFWTYNAVGMLLFDGLIDARKVYGLMGPMVTAQWDKWNEIVWEMRKELSMPIAYAGFEHLGMEMKKLEDEGYHISLAQELIKTDK